MIYNLTCPICNTNLKDFNIEKVNNGMLEFDYATINCKCKPNDCYSICSGIYIYISNDYIIIESCYEDIGFYFRNNNRFTIQNLISGANILDLNIEYFLKKPIENIPNLLYNIDYLYLIANKIEKSMLFL